MELHATTSATSIKDYLLSNEVNSFAKGSGQYEVVLQNNTDFVISRKAVKTTKELVILISQGLFYIKDSKLNHIEEVTTSRLKAFLRDLRDASISLNQVKWLPSLDKNRIDYLVSVISDNIYVDMCKHGVLADIKDPSWYSTFWEQNKKLFLKIYSMFPTISDTRLIKYRSSFPIIFEIDKLYGYNEAIYFAELLLGSGINEYTSALENYGYYRSGELIENSSMKGFLQLLGKPYELNLRRLIEYIFFDAYSQGIIKIDGAFWKTYEDYLSMQLKIFGKIREKYPKHLKTEHDVLALKVNMFQCLTKCEDFAARTAEISNIAYSGPKYSIVVPETPQQLADEGINLSHCVGGYVDRIIEGNCHILFLRKTNAMDRSLVTLQLCNGRINQAEGYHRRDITTEERTFLHRWGREKDIQIAV